MMGDPGRVLGVEQVRGRGREECEHVGVGERRRIRDIHHRVRPHQNVCEPLASNGVHARIRRRRDGLVTLLGEMLDDLGSDEARASDDNDLHD
jgi:hypothetical protein